MSEKRDERILADFEALTRLKEASTIFDFETAGSPPDRYMIKFRGRGVTKARGLDVEIEYVDNHECEIRLPYSYPDSPPDLKWLTPIFHPNLSYSGYVNLETIELDWDKNFGLDLVCERLWDVVRLAYLNIDRASNYSAGSWFESQTDLDLPVDARPLRDRGNTARSNIVRYRRKGESPSSHEESHSSSDIDILYIGEESTTPEVSPNETPRTQPQPSPPRRPAPRRVTDNDDDILYIGDD